MLLHAKLITGNEQLFQENNAKIIKNNSDVSDTYQITDRKIDDIVLRLQDMDSSGGD